MPLSVPWPSFNFLKFNVNLGRPTVIGVCPHVTNAQTTICLRARGDALSQRYPKLCKQCAQKAHAWKSIEAKAQLASDHIVLVEKEQDKLTNMSAAIDSFNAAFAPKILISLLFAFLIWM
jgi:hypothetical protein